ncbi:MAG TPA: TIGR00153 family protein [Gammaproteobacteria bacterium]|nr:TIGR00153 family protein [Gammaproteobacteria bacterium]
MSPKLPFATLFGTSPVRPLQEHMDKVALCAAELVVFFKAVIADDWAVADKARARITDLEHEADDMKKNIRLHMPKSLFMPVPRADLLDMLTMQDKIANRAKDITGIMTGRHMRLPSSTTDLFLALVQRSVDAAMQAKKSVNELDELYETGFRGAEVDLVVAMISELDTIERDTDKLQIKLRAELFAIEKDLPPVDVMFLYRIIQGIGDVGDLSQRVGSRLQLLLAH